MRGPTLLLVALLVAGSAARAHESHEPATDADRFRTSRVDARGLVLPDERDRFTFAVFGDRTGGPAEGVRILEQAVTEVNLLAPDLVMTVGDLIQGYNRSPTWLTEMREYHGVMDRLTMPWFPVAGNHDVYWRGAGERQAGEHEGNYERHFGPLWYAFRHKDSWFVVLYTDEGDPATDKRGFYEPAQQRMSPAQFAFLRETLTAAREARHVFVFLHHPRWIGGGYGDDWERVHRLLVDAGNVTAVFAGHIHHMRYDPRDGIEYFTLATVGGTQSAVVPEAGFLHHYMYVTVDGGGIAAVSYPVGSADDPREITGDVASESRQLARALVPRIAGDIVLAADFAGSGNVDFAFKNPTSRPAELAVSVESPDGRWRAVPDREHVVLDAGATRNFSFRLTRPAGPLDPAWALPRVVVAADYLAPGRRFALPRRSTPVPVRTTVLPAPARPVDGVERVLLLDGKDDHLIARLPAADAARGPFTFELWFRTDDARTGRQTLAVSHRSSALALEVDHRDLELTADGGAGPRRLEADDKIVSDRWHHVAGTCDGDELALYLDGRRTARADIDRCPKLDRSPLLVGTSLSRVGAPVRAFSGAVDDVRVTRSAISDGKRFSPSRRPADDGPTALLLHMDAEVGPWLFDGSPARSHPSLEGGAHVGPDHER